MDLMDVSLLLRTPRRIPETHSGCLVPHRLKVSRLLGGMNPSKLTRQGDNTLNQCRLFENPSLLPKNPHMLHTIVHLSIMPLSRLLLANLCLRVSIMGILIATLPTVPEPLFPDMILMCHRRSMAD